MRETWRPIDTDSPPRGERKREIEREGDNISGRNHPSVRLSLLFLFPPPPPSPLTSIFRPRKLLRGRKKKEGEGRDGRRASYGVEKRRPFSRDASTYLVTRIKFQRIRKQETRWLIQYSLSISFLF